MYLSSHKLLYVLLIDCLEEGGSRLFRNAGNNKSASTALHTKRLKSWTCTALCMITYITCINQFMIQFNRPAANSEMEEE
jgi:hypothetical protein